MVKTVLISMIVGALAGLLRAIRVRDHQEEVVFKTAASLLFVILGAIAWNGDNPVATWVLVGLALCALGDVLLIWDHTFDIGLISFLLGHVAYVAAFAAAAPATEWARWILLPIALTSSAALAWLWPHLGRHRPSVGAYVVVITIMVWGALAVASTGVLGSMIAIGAVLFYLSDLTVARDRFVHADFINRAIGLPMYYAAQVLIALSV
ncbi:MAG: lysoplasmalogenase [Candidatus Aminicenantes bacterium]|nr:MAG: lysoplasmalogenase [Candidatus Aminicenantes bacterium]